MPRLTWDQVRGWRLARHHLVRRAPKRRLLEVVREVCGVHAQVQSAAELQVWARVEGATPDDVRDALWQRRTLVRTWAMRGTLHLLTAEDLPLYVAALRTHDRWWKGAWLRYVGLSEPELRAMLEAIRASLGARPLTRQQLAEKVVRRVGEKGRERLLSNWGELLKPAAFHGHLCSGPPRGQNVTFVRPEKWLSGWKDRDSGQAWQEILRRFLRAYGPATREEFARWWGMQPAAAGRMLKAMPDGSLTVADVEGTPMVALPQDVAAMGEARADDRIRLLPAFDAYVVGSRPKESLVDRRFEGRVFRQAGWISPVVLAGGKVAGVWKHERNGGRLEVAVAPFGRLSAGQKKGIAEEADRLGEFLGAPAAVVYLTRPAPVDHRQPRAGGWRGPPEEGVP